MDDWQAGDLAKCVRDDWPARFAHLNPPKVGDENMVAEVDLSMIWCSDCGGLHLAESLRFVGGEFYWDSRAFVKVQPRGEDQTVPETVKVPEHA